MKNSDDKITIHYEDLQDYYDLYVNGLNVVASGTLYLTGDNGLLANETAITINGIDTGETGMEYDFDVISKYCIRVNQFQPLGSGELDFIFVNDGHLYKLSEMYDYGYQKIDIINNIVYYPITSSYGLRNDNISSYIDTEYIPNKPNNIIEIDLKVPIGSSIVYSGIYSKPNHFSFGAWQNSFDRGYCNFGNSGRTTSNGINVQNRHKLKIDANLKLCYLDDIQFSSFNSSDTNQNITANFFMFAYNNNDATVHGGIQTIYSLKIWEGETLVRYYIPVEAGSTLWSKTPAPSNCMIDIVNRTYYTGAGSFTFIDES